MRMSEVNPKFLKSLKIVKEFANSDSRIPLGTKIGRVTVEEYKGMCRADNNQINHYYTAHCDCGNPEELLFPETSLKSVGLPGKLKTISCGCAAVERTKKMQDIHRRNKYNKDQHKAVTIYYAIRQRCYSPTYKKYKNYGARGIKMCPEWEDRNCGLDNFCDWMYNVAGYTDDMGPTVSIDRIDNDGPYSPENCHLSTNNGQASNKTQNVNHVWYNQLYNTRDLCNHYGCNYDRFRRLYYEGKSIHEILFGPIFYSSFERATMLNRSPNGLIITPRPFVIEPFRFVDHSEIGPRNKWRPRSYNDFCPNETASEQTLNMLADKYRIAERDAGRAIKPFQFTNSDSTDFLLSANICAENYNF